MNTAIFKIFPFILCIVLSCSIHAQKIIVKDAGQTLPGASQTEAYLSLIQNKTIGVVANQTSLISKTHLVDSLLNLGIKIQCIFTPEHGFRGEADAGAHIIGGKDSQTGIDIVSLYGSHKKPTIEDLRGIDIMLFDLQDVGVRFYTYISTLTYVMEACAEQNIPVIVLDRPNPNGFYIDGPVLEKEYQSFVGLHTVPVVYGMTIGEYARMVNGEKWLTNQLNCDLTVIPLSHYDRNAIDKLAVRPSPNLPNYQAIFLYPSLCLFEGTSVSIGRGTDFPFQVYGHPNLPETTFSFIPESRAGASAPKHHDTKCNGFDLRTLADQPEMKYGKLNLQWLMQAYQSLKQDKFFNSYFEKLAGTSELRRQIEGGKSEEEIRNSWQNGIEQFKKTRAKYLLYPDFEE
ncbi:MAG: exo-beta-N-acetylmuramidase NamZ domain-containing protein [Bacteroidales bacterium]